MILGSKFAHVEDTCTKNQNQRFSSGWGRVLAYLILSASAIVPSLFFFSKWAINAECFGKHDLGYGLFFSFAFATLFHVSWGLALLGFLAALISLFRHRPARIYLLAMILALLPIGYLFLLDIPGR